MADGGHVQATRKAHTVTGHSMEALCIHVLLVRGQLVLALLHRKFGLCIRFAC